MMLPVSFALTLLWVTFLVFASPPLSEWDGSTMALWGALALAVGILTGVVLAFLRPPRKEGAVRREKSIEELDADFFAARSDLEESMVAAAKRGWKRHKAGRSGERAKLLERAKAAKVGRELDELVAVVVAGWKMVKQRQVHEPPSWEPQKCRQALTGWESEDDTVMKEVHPYSRHETYAMRLLRNLHPHGFDVILYALADKTWAVGIERAGDPLAYDGPRAELAEALSRAALLAVILDEEER